MTLSVVILAAGQGTRMKSSLPKVLHPLGGRPLARYSVETVVVKRWWVAESHSDPGRAGQPAEPWIEIELPSKRRGYMAKRSVRWVGAMRVTFSKRGARWWVTAVETGL